MRVVIDTEADSLTDPTKIWCIVCKNIDNSHLSIFREPYDDFLTYAKSVNLWIGHNILDYDFPVLHKLLGMEFPDPTTNVIDTLIVSRLVNYSRQYGHSIEAYGIEFEFPKGKNHYLDFFKSWSRELEDYCVRDVEICEKIYWKYASYINDPAWQSALSLEHRFQLIVNSLHEYGFAFNRNRAEGLLGRVTRDLEILDKQILEAFPPREVLIREFTPKPTKFGTISRTSVPRSLHHKLHEFECGKTYRHTRLEPFNPSSHKQLIEVLNAAGWRPEDKTQAHIEAERAFNIQGKVRQVSQELKNKIEKFKSTGWKVNENNLGTLPPDAPEGARLLALRILLEARRRSLVEWIGLVSADGRIHGKFVGIGAWTHRMAHQRPNTANIPREFKEDGTPKLLGRELRELWCAPKNRLLVGVDAEGIQLRIFAHYIDDEEFTHALVRGSKANKTDPHSLNQRILGSVCKTRQAAKRFVYALLLGGGIGKLAVILGCSVPEAREALDRLLERYTGFARLRKTQIPRDARQGWFEGLDGRHVPIPGETQRDREHLCMSGYLQNGEAIIIKKSALLIRDALQREYDEGKWRFVNIVHDELQSECGYSRALAEKIAKIKAQAIVDAGEYYRLKCPMAGSWWNDDENRATIGTNWYQTH